MNKIIVMATCAALILSLDVATAASGKRASKRSTASTRPDYFSRSYQESQGETLGHPNGN
jgi:hypothetical protein